MKTNSVIKAIVDILLIFVIALYIITGYGITEYQILEAFTFSVLTKPISHLIHSNLIIPFVILLIFHVFLYKLHFFKKLVSRKCANE